jgi:predicted nucleic acid-binding protein
MIYLDSCALVKLVIDERETPALERYLDSRESDIVSCQLALTEVIRAVRRSCYDAQRRLVVEPAILDERLLGAAALLEGIDLVVVDKLTLTRGGAYDGDPHVGSLDAIHLVSAAELGDVLTAFVTYDKRLAQAANDRGLPVAQPA